MPDANCMLLSGTWRGKTEAVNLTFSGGKASHLLWGLVHVACRAAGPSLPPSSPAGLPCLYTLSTLVPSCSLSGLIEKAPSSRKPTGELLLRPLILF